MALPRDLLIFAFPSVPDEPADIANEGGGFREDAVEHPVEFSCHFTSHFDVRLLVFSDGHKVGAG